MSNLTTAPPAGAPSVRRRGGGRTPASRRRITGAGGNRHLFFILPAALFLLVFAVYPVVQLVRMSLSDVRVDNLGADWQFVGLENVIRNFGDGAFGGVIINTVVFVAIVTVLGLVGGLAAAILLAPTGKWPGLILALLVFVWALPPVVNGSVWKFLLGTQGLFNTLLTDLGLASTAVPFLFDDRLALVSVALVNSWVVIPFNALVYRAAIIGIPGELFEASRVDGASRWQEIRHVIIPSVRSTTMILTVLTVVYGFRSFDFIYVMTFGGPGTATTTLPFLGYVQAFVRFDFGLGASTALIAVLMVLVLAVIYARNVRQEEK
ncbi:sugar ABC transporter permease [Microbacterium sp. ET2]|uniref:carbohydrate ABC transporter permease n=1 Tax=Microbacterium albipurpureum TaxID=3050384 RepID=UPI00259D226B|nr:sugar ABC transporter permease [Microbacterium sp. ET2 (Ac-2212)]WJL94720.1 sugar ABC transporter permease [Microbacterium sp. ET2 (Ac-2212)]